MARVEEAATHPRSQRLGMTLRCDKCRAASVGGRLGTATQAPAIEKWQPDRQTYNFTSCVDRKMQLLSRLL